jgi:hypothetical protein
MPEGSAINDIMQMRQQGLSNNQIIQNLQRQGYTNTQIFDAMNQADTKMAVEGMQTPMQQVSQSQQHSDMFTQPSNQPQQVMQQPQQTQQTGGFQLAPRQEPEYEPDSVKVEELVEVLIEEKWSELVRDVNKIVDWKNKIENRISEIELKLDNLRDNYSDMNKAILGKVNEYDKHILEIGSDLKAMEKVFSKILPKFTENVNELSRIADKVRK